MLSLYAMVRAIKNVPTRKAHQKRAHGPIYDPGGQHHWGGQRRCSKRLVQCGECVELRSIRGGGPGGDRHQKARRAAARGPALGRTSGLDMCCAARPLKRTAAAARFNLSRASASTRSALARSCPPILMFLSRPTRAALPAPCTIRSERFPLHSHWWSSIDRTAPAISSALRRFRHEFLERPQPDRHCSSFPSLAKRTEPPSG
jgi:hypothetical protein